MATAELLVRIVGDTKGLQRTLDQGESKLRSFGKGAAIVGGVLAGAVAGGAAFAVKAFNDFDAGLDAIRTGTGKTGTELASLEKNFRNVNRTVVSTEGEVGTAVAGLSSRLGIQGKELEDLAKQTLNLARITKSDLGQTIEDSTRVFGDWAISTDKQGTALDFLFRVSQKTKVPIADLMGVVVQFGAPLRSLGFDFETAAVLIGKFQAEGVNTEAVMAGLKIGLANIAAQGKPIKETFLGAIESIKGAKEPTDALTQGIAIFGKRAGPDLVEAIRQGRFDGLAPLVEDLKTSKETINDATSVTDDMGEKWKIVSKGIKEAAVVVITPALDELTTQLGIVQGEMGETGVASEDLKKIGEGLAGAIRFIAGATRNWITGLEELGEMSVKFQPLIDVLGKILKLLNAISPTATIKAAIKTISEVPGLQHGGPVTMGSPYIVGEKGPEVFVPNASGTIVPNRGGQMSAVPSGGDVIIVLDGKEIARVVGKHLGNEAYLMARTT